jgi:hypothetical protein
MFIQSDRQEAKRKLSSPFLPLLLLLLLLLAFFQRK